MNLKELKSLELKKFLHASQCKMRWHNKNKNGGNFGLEIRGVRGKDWELWCHYDKEGLCYFLKFGYLYDTRIPLEAENFEDLKNKIFYIIDEVVKEP